jgi:hypothetical protein
MAWHKVNSLDVQLDEFSTSDKQASKQITNKIQVRDTDKGIDNRARQLSTPEAR